MDMPINRFKLGLREGRWQLGLFAGLANPLSMELLAGCGFDWLLVDAEHSPNTAASVLAQLQAAAAHPVQLLVRPAGHDPVPVKQYLDAGAQTLMFPMVEDAAQARDLVRAMRYPPAGIRGVATSLARAAQWTGIPDYLSRADAETCLVVQIETRRGLENLESIVGVDGVDAAFIGPADLAASLGHLGNAGHPEVRAAMEQAVRRIVACGKAAGLFVTDPGLAGHYRALGASFVAVGGDATLLRSAALRLIAGFRDN